ncbi:MAG: DUF952 domain-containing protein [Methylobacteriaceae bacterium]|nr:DUF952 domain-containing protein [Methylobacteriaceae bacterium]
MTSIYKIVRRREWREAEARGVYLGSADDLRDGFIHLSTAGQVAGTLARHFTGEPDLLLVTVEAEAFGDELRWEPSRGGQLFPHLYGPLPVPLARSVAECPVAADGQHVLPPELAR